MKQDEKDLGKAVLTLMIIVIGFVTLGMWGCPKYHVYEQDMNGKAQLAQAVGSRKILVQEAEAKMEAATLLAKADIARAEGVAQANRIIGDSLKGNEAYLRYLWISSLEQGSGKEVIYVPTEAGLPILEAGKRGQ